MYLFSETLRQIRSETVSPNSSVEDIQNESYGISVYRKISPKKTREREDREREKQSWIYTAFEVEVSQQIIFQSGV